MTPGPIVKTLLVPAVLLSLLLTGCGKTISPNSARPDPLPGAYYPKIAIEGAFRDKIVTPVDRIVFTPGTEAAAGSAGTPASVAVPIRSLVRHEVWTQHRFLWFNAQGIQVGDTGWRRALLEPQIEQQFQATSATGEAQDWRMEIRFGR
jgi:uncharacterized protein YcfL